MTFRDHFYSRLLALETRDTQEFPGDIFPENYYHAAVLLLFWPGDKDNVEVVLTKRTNTLPTHQGQVSFPGGKMQVEDTGLIDTALREAHEELGIEVNGIRIMGRLDDAWSSHGHHVIPFVGWTDIKPCLVPNPSEVAEVIIGDVATLMLPETITAHTVRNRGRTRITHAFNWEGGYVWGMTADILLELFLWVNGVSSNRGEIRLEYMKKQLGLV